MQTEEVFDLGGEDGDGDTAGESYHNRVGDIFDDGAEMEQTEEHQEGTRHEGGNGQSLDAVLLDDAVDDDDKRTGRSAYLHLAATEYRDDETGHDGCDDTLFGSHSRCDTEGDGQRQGHDTHNDSRHHIGGEILLVVVPQGVEDLGSKLKRFHVDEFVI